MRSLDTLDLLGILTTRPFNQLAYIHSTLEVLLSDLHVVLCSGTSVHCSCRNFGASIVTLVLLPVLYFVMVHSGTSVRSTSVRSRTSRWVVHSPVHYDGYAYVLGLRVVLYTTLRRPQRQLLRQRVQSKNCPTALRGSGYRCFCRMCPFCALQTCGGAPTETVMSAFGPFASSTGNFNFSIFWTT